MSHDPSTPERGIRVPGRACLAPASSALGATTPPGPEIILHVPEPPDELDPTLWVKADGYEGLLLLGYNPHLSPGSGRICVWSEELGSTTRISTRDITAASDAALVWLAGFFAGSEPDPHEMFGPTIHEAPESDPRWQRYWDANRCPMRSLT